jgi:hypothetical protein
MTVQLIQYCPSLQLLQSSFQNIALKDTEMNDYHCFNFKSVDPKQPKNVKKCPKNVPRGGA